ncbi:PmrA [Streptomyces sp. NPDC002133]
MTTVRFMKGGYASMRSLEWHARLGVDATARHVTGRDPAAHRRR